ncbi:MAG TPA: hypothetical protein VF057_06020 [Thermoanaerobaculia bacterium]
MLAATLALLGAVLFDAAPEVTSTRQPLIITSQDHSLANAENCEHFHTRTLTTLPSTAHLEGTRNLQLSDARQLTVRTGSEGGVLVRGWDKSFARLTVCKSAAAENDREADKIVRQIEVAVSGNEIVARGPQVNDAHAWWVDMILWVPKTARLDVTAANGGIAIRNMTGRVTARATNGGISIAGCAGEHHLETKKGGISIDKVSGSVNAKTESGPISLKLRTAAVPALEASTDEHGEIVCNVKACSSTLGQWTADRKRLRIGGDSAPSIRLTSYSADIMIEQVR